MTQSTTERRRFGLRRNGVAHHSSLTRLQLLLARLGPSCLVSSACQLLETEVPAEDKRLLDWLGHHQNGLFAARRVLLSIHPLLPPNSQTEAWCVI